MCLIKIYGQKNSNSEYVYKTVDEKNICRISVSKCRSMQNVKIEGLGLNFVSDFDIESTLVPGIKRSVCNEDEKVGYLEYLGGKNLELMCKGTTFDISVSSVYYGVDRDSKKIATIHRFWREDAPIHKLDGLPGFPVEVMEDLTDTELLFVLAMPILRFDFGIDEFDCIM